MASEADQLEEIEAANEEFLLVSDDIDTTLSVMVTAPDESVPPLSSDDLQEADQADDEMYQLKTTYANLEAIDPNDLISLFFKEAAQFPLLTHKDEVHLAKRIERGLNSQRLHINMSEFGVLDERLNKLQNYIDDGNEARSIMVNSNIFLSVSIAKKYMGYGIEFLDLINDGITGLIIAADKFDHRRGNKFSTFAVWWIRQAITLAIADKSRRRRVPVHTHEAIMHMSHATRMLHQELQRRPEPEEIAQRLNELKWNKTEEKLRLKLGRDPDDDEIRKSIQGLWTAGKVLKLRIANSEDIAMDEQVNDDTEATRGDFMADTDSISPPDEATYILMQEYVSDNLDKLPPREARVLALRFGVRGCEPHTLEEVGQMMNVTRERIRQIEAQALTRLGKFMKHDKSAREFLD